MQNENQTKNNKLLRKNKKPMFNLQAVFNANRLSLIKDFECEKFHENFSNKDIKWIEEARKLDNNLSKRLPYANEKIKQISFQMMNTK